MANQNCTSHLVPFLTN